MKSIYLSRLQNSEHLILMKDIHLLLKEANIPQLEILKGELAEQIKFSEAAQTQIRKSYHTNELIELDNKRNAFYKGFLLKVQSEEFSAVEDRRKDAKKVLLVINSYGNLTKFNYQKETIEIQNFLSDLKSHDYLPSVQRIGAFEWITWLESANNAFNDLYTERRDEYASQVSYDIKSIRKESDAIFKNIQKMVEALRILQPSDELNIFISKANTSLNKWRDILAQRIGRGNASQNGKSKENSTENIPE